MSLVAKYKGKAEQLHVLKENSGLKVRNYEVQLEEVQERNTALAKENVALNEGLHQQRRATHKAQDEARACENRWEGGATNKERQALEDALAQREGKCLTWWCTNVVVYECGGVRMWWCTNVVYECGLRMWFTNVVDECG